MESESEVFEFQSNPQVKNYQQSFQELMNSIGVLAVDEAFEEIYGFRLKEYLEQRDLCGKLMRGISDYLDKVAFDCGVAKIAGGTGSIIGGLMAGAGLLLVPVTAGGSLALTIGGGVIGLGSAATSFTSTIMSDYHLKDKVKYAENIVEKLKQKNKTIEQILFRAKKSFDMLHKYSSEELFIKWIQFVSMNGFKSGMFVLKGTKLFKSSTQIISVTRSVANTVSISFQINCKAALAAAAPQIKVFSYSIANAGSRLSQGLTAITAVAGIVFGIIDIIHGAEQVQGMKQAETLRESSFDFDAVTRQIDNLVNFAKKSANLPQYNRKKLCLLISKDSQKLFDFQPPNKHVHIWQLAKVKNQMIEIGSGFHTTFKNHDNGLFATVDSIENFCEVQQKPFNKDLNQYFTLVPVEKGKMNQYTIECKNNKAFDVDGWGKDNGTRVILWDKHGGDNQVWSLCSLEKQTVSEKDCDGFGAYLAETLFIAPANAIQEAGSMVSDALHNTILPNNRIPIKCKQCKQNLSIQPYYIVNQNYLQCNSCGKVNNPGDDYVYCSNKCSKWGFCKDCTNKQIVPYGCDTKRCKKCNKTSLKSYKFYGANWNYSNCNGCKQMIPLNTYYWYCSDCKTWGYCYSCTMKGQCGKNG